MTRVQLDTSYESPDNLSPDYAPWDTSSLSETCRNYMLVRDSILKDMQVLSQQENQRKRERSLDTSIELLSPPSKKPVKERLGTRGDQDKAPTPSNSPADQTKDLTQKFTVINNSSKEKSEPCIVDVSSSSSSSSGIISNTSNTSPNSPEDPPRNSPIATRAATQGPPPRRALLPDFEKPKIRPPPLMSINASQFRFPPPTSTPRAHRFTQRCPPPRVSGPRPPFKPVRFPRHPVPSTEYPNQGNSQASHPPIPTASSSTKRKDHPEEVQDLRSKIP